MVFHRFVHPALVPRPAPPDEDTETVRRIVAHLEALPPERATHLAAFAYILVRVINADAQADDAAEVHELEVLVADFGGVPEALAVVVAEIARTQSRLVGATEDFLVTRRFREVSTGEERERLLHCLFAVATSGDRVISDAQNAEIHEIADELGFTIEELNSVRRSYADRIAAVRYAKGVGQAG